MSTIPKTHWLAIGASAAIVVGALVVSLSLFGEQSKTKTSPSPTPTPTPTAAVSAPASPVAAAAAPNQAAGSAPATIQGQKIFPSEAIPSDFRVCAVNVSTQETVCTAASSAPTYSVPVPAGSYQIYAVVPSFDPNYRAYYSRFVTCGLRAECTDHSPITVTVTGGQVSGGIDVGDFYHR